MQIQPVIDAIMQSPVAAGVAGGFVRWASFRELRTWREWWLSVVVGGLLGAYLAPSVAVLVGLRLELAGFAVGTIGMSFTGLILDIAKAVIKFKTGGGDNGRGDEK